MRLSVIVPFHDVETYAVATLRSLQRNAADDVEFLLVDDASTDGTSAILAEQSGQLPGSTVLTSTANIGVAAARNRGIAAARGRYLTFLDGDDFVAPGYYATLLGTIERLGCDMVRTDHVRVHGRKRSVARIGYGIRGVVRSPREAILPVRQSTSVDTPNAWSGIYDRRLADSGLLYFPEHLRTCEDRLWNWRLHLSVPTFAMVGLCGVFYRRDVPASLTSVSDARQFDFLAAFDQIVEEVTADPDAAALLPKAVRSYCSMICHHLARSDTYSPFLAARLTELCRSALRRLPPSVLDQVVSELDPKRAALITGLRAAA